MSARRRVPSAGPCPLSNSKRARTGPLQSQVAESGRTGSGEGAAWAPRRPVARGSRFLGAAATCHGNARLGASVAPRDSMLAATSPPEGRRAANGLPPRFRQAGNLRQNLWGSPGPSERAPGRARQRMLSQDVGFGRRSASDASRPPVRALPKLSSATEENVSLGLGLGLGPRAPEHLREACGNRRRASRV